MVDTPSPITLVGMVFLESQYSGRRGTVLAQVASEHYLVRSLDRAEGTSANVVPVSDMKSWKFFDSRADLEA
jgi:hypothetical protein